MADVFSRVEQLQRIAEKMMTERDWALRRVRELEAERDRLAGENYGLMERIAELGADNCSLLTIIDEAGLAEDIRDERGLLHRLRTAMGRREKRIAELEAERDDWKWRLLDVLKMDGLHERACPAPYSGVCGCALREALNKADTDA